MLDVSAIVFLPAPLLAPLKFFSLGFLESNDVWAVSTSAMAAGPAGSAIFAVFAGILVRFVVVLVSVIPGTFSICVISNGTLADLLTTRHAFGAEAAGGFLTARGAFGADAAGIF